MGMAGKKMALESATKTAQGYVKKTLLPKIKDCAAILKKTPQAIKGLVVWDADYYAPERYFITSPNGLVVNVHPHVGIKRMGYETHLPSKGGEFTLDELLKGVKSLEEWLDEVERKLSRLA